jgi:hypothetical protein
MTDSSRFPVLNSSQVVQRFRDKGKWVITFLGFGELGYEEPSSIRQIAERLLAQRDPNVTIVNTGTLIRVGGLDGIASVYPIAKALGFETTGVHPSIALSHAQTHQVSPYVQEVYFVQDSTWGGYLPESGEPSPTLQTLLTITDECVVIGGDKHTADEMQAFRDQGTPVIFHAAQMNHHMTRQWAKDAGLELPNFDGAAYEVWRREDSHCL